MESVRASVRYLNAEWRAREERPRIGSRESRRANTSFHDVDIYNARQRAEEGSLELDRQGFTLTRHRSAVRDFRDAAQIEEVYYPEWAERLRELTGATEVLFLQHLIRTETPESFNEAYARYVHCDFGDALAEDLARRLYAGRKGVASTETLTCDYAWYNVWQPIEREVQQNPLTLIEASTVAREDIVEYVYAAAGADAVSSMPVHSATHRFFYFPRMQTEEAIVFKQFDGREGRAFACPHTSFDDSTAPKDTLGRRSIEVRALAIFAG